MTRRAGPGSPEGVLHEVVGSVADLELGPLVLEEPEVGPDDDVLSRRRASVPALREQAYAPIGAESGGQKGNFTAECEFKIAQPSAKVSASLRRRLDRYSLLYSRARCRILRRSANRGGALNAPVLFSLARKRRRANSISHPVSRQLPQPILPRRSSAKRRSLLIPEPPANGAAPGLNSPRLYGGGQPALGDG